MADAGGLFGMDPSLLLNVGLGLMSASGRDPGHPNVGTAVSNSLGNYYNQQEAKQRLGLGQLQMQLMQQEQPLRMAMLEKLGHSLHAANNDETLTPQLHGLMGPSTAGPAGSPAGPPPAPPATSPTSPMPPGVQTLPEMTVSAPSAAPPQAPSPAPMGAGLMGGDEQDAFGDMNNAVLMGALGMPGAAQAMEAAKTRLQYNVPLATRMEAAKSSIAIDQQQIQQALNSGNTQMALAIAQKMRQDLGLLHIASMSGTQTRIGLGGDISTFNPNEGVQTVNGVESAIPGAAAAKGSIAAAEAVGRAAGETVELTDKAGNRYLVPKSAVVGGMGARGATPGASGMPLQTSLGPGSAEMLKGNASAALETNKEFQNQAEQGQQMLAQTEAIRAASKNFTPGRFADTRATVLDYLNSSGLITPDEKKALGSYQEGQKIAIQLQAAATKQLGSREAAQIFEKMGKSLPNLTMSQNGLSKVIAWQQGISRYQIARAESANQLAQSNNATGVNQVRDTWIKNSNPLYYIMASADSQTRLELLQAMGKEKMSKFVADWNAAANAGFAPRVEDYAR